MKKNDIPNGPHYAIMVIDMVSVHIPGDERSRTNPGHGYPESTEYYDNITYYAFPEDQKSKWEVKIQELYGDERTRPKVHAFHVDKVAQPKIKIEVQL